MCAFPHSYVATLGTHWKWIFLIVSLLFGFTESHLASVMSGDPRPPFVNRIVRVNRGPSIPSSIEEEASLFLKSPAYQLRFRPHRLSQFHGYPVLNGQIPNSNGLSIFNMPGIASHHAPTMALNNNSPQLPAIPESAEVAELVDNQQPTFTPFISARALSNIEKFFEHLRENIEALQSTDGVAERSQRSNDGLDEDNPSEDSTGISWENSAELPSVLSTSYRGGGFRWIPAASGAHHRDNRDQTSSGFSPGIDQDPPKSRPKFNPSWVKLGLGKRKR